MATHHNFRQNTILDSLPVADYKRLHSHMEQVVLAQGDVLQEPGIKMSHIYFPSTSIISLMSTMENGNSIEIAAVGNEGMVGVTQFSNANFMPTRAVVQQSGWAIRMQASIISNELGRIGGRRKGFLYDSFMLYTQQLINEITQTAICNQHHKLDQQLCRWLLLRLDRQVSNELEITQELIANKLGVSRNAVSQAAGKLQQEGLIDYKRGRLKVLNRMGLEIQTCECYKAVMKASGYHRTHQTLTPTNQSDQYRPIKGEVQ